MDSVVDLLVPAGERSRLMVACTMYGVDMHNLRSTIDGRVHHIRLICAKEDKMASVVDSLRRSRRCYPKMASVEVSSDAARIVGRKPHTYSSLDTRGDNPNRGK